MGSEHEARAHPECDASLFQGIIYTYTHLAAI